MTNETKRSEAFDAPDGSGWAAWGRAIHAEVKRREWRNLIAFHLWVTAMNRAGWLRGHHEE
jgi:hypothetical protein